MASVTARAQQTTSAFTLIELLVTVVILSTGIVLILQAFQTSMLALAESRDSIRSSALCHALAVQGELEARRFQADIDDGVLRARYPDYRWRIDTRSDSGGACTNAAWYTVEVVGVVNHEVTGRQAEMATWVQVAQEEVGGER